MKQAKKVMAKCSGYDKGRCLYLHDGDRSLACPIKTSLYQLLCTRFIDEVLPVFAPELYTEVVAKGKTVKKCTYCGKGFIAGAPRQLYCSKKCSQDSRRKSEAKRQRNNRAKSTQFELLKTS